MGAVADDPNLAAVGSTDASGETRAITGSAAIEPAAAAVTASAVDAAENTAQVGSATEVHATESQVQHRRENTARKGRGMALLALLLFGLCVYLGYDLYYGHNGYLQYEKVAAQFNQAEQKSLQLKQRNQDLAEQITDLQQGSIAVEELARSELGLIKPNERFYRVLADDQQIRSMPIP